MPALPFRSVSDRPGGINDPLMLGDRAASESLQMHSDSRKAQLNSFAHHRAALLFSSHLARRGDAKQWSAAVHEGTEPSADLTQRVIAGIRSFARAPVAVA